MISRKTTIAIGKVYRDKFTKIDDRYLTLPGDDPHYIVKRNDLYDFLYERDYEPWLCNKAKTLYHNNRSVQELIMMIHTGETQSKEGYESWNKEQKEKLGQNTLENLTRDILYYYYYNESSDKTGLDKIDLDIYLKDLTNALELDGYIYRDDMLLIPESDVLDTEEETGTLKSLYKSLGLEDKQTAFHHLDLSEKDYLDNRWDNSISNSRKFLECVLRETAMAHSKKYAGKPLAKSKYKSPVKVREYLENESLLGTKETKTIASVYHLLSSTGGHPYMADNDQARLLRHLSLTLSQFALLRLDGLFSSVS